MNLQHVNQTKTLLVFAMAGPTDEKIRELQDRLLDLNERNQVIQALADSENRSISEDEQREIQSNFSQFDQIEEEIERRQLIAEQTAKLARPQGRMSTPVDPASTAGSDPADAAPQSPVRPDGKRKVAAREFYMPEDRGKWGWHHIGEYAMAVRKAAGAVKNGQMNMVDPRLVMNAPTTYSSEGVGADGGFAVPPDFRTDIWQKVAGEDSLLKFTDQQVSSKNTMVWPADETTPWDTTGGIQAYWESEAGLLTQAKIALKEKTIRLNKLTALIPVTEELMEDAPAIDSYLRTKTGQKFDFKITDKLINGVGAGEPLGLLKSAALVSVAKESGQDADTVLSQNIMNIWSRMYAPCRRKSIWLINQDIEPQLFQMYVAVGTGGIPVYMPANGLSQSPYGTLMGRPVIPTQACQSLGSQGDIILVDFSQYLTATKTSGVRTDVSMHLWFDYDVLAYRFIIRMAGQPWWATYITPKNGTNYLSFAVTLDERS